MNLPTILAGLLIAAVSACIALAMGVVSATMGRWADRAVCFVIDLVMGIPHILLLILIYIILILLYRRKQKQLRRVRKYRDL